MKTTGEILREQRLQKKLTFEEIEKTTRIRKKYLEALETGDLDKLPGETYVQGFVKNYAEFLGLSTENVLAVLRREYYEKRKKEIIPPGLAHPLLPKNIFSKIVAIPLTFFLALSILGGYLYHQYQVLESTPGLVIEEPKDKEVIKKDSVVVKGKTDKENRVFINSQEINVNSEGFFSQKLTLKKGENTISIISVNKQGKETKIERIVNKTD